MGVLQLMLSALMISSHVMCHSSQQLQLQLGYIWLHVSAVTGHLQAN